MAENKRTKAERRKNAWLTFDKVLNEEGNICGARCKRCSKVLNHYGTDRKLEHQAVCASKKRSGIENTNPNSSNDRASDEETSDIEGTGTPCKRVRRSISNLEEADIALANLLVSEGKCMDTPIPYWLNKLCQALNGNFIVPSPEKLKTEILPKAIAASVLEHSEAIILPCLYVQTCMLNFTDNNSESVEKLFVIVLGVTNALEYEFIDQILLDNDISLYVQFEQYLDATVRKTTDRFRKKVLCVVTNFEGDMEVLSKFESSNSHYNYCRAKNFEILAKSLAKEDSSHHFSVSNAGLLLDHNRKVDEFLKKLSQDNMTMSEAVQYLFKCLLDKTFDFDVNAKDTVLQFLTPFHVGCNMLDHRFHMSTTTELEASIKEDLDDLLTDFVSTLPTQTYAEFGEYSGLAENQKGLFRKDKSYEPEQFWDLAQIKFQQLPKVGKDIIRIPAVFPTVDMKEMYDLIQKIINDTDNLTYQMRVMLKNIHFK